MERPSATRFFSRCGWASAGGLLCATMLFGGLLLGAGCAGEAPSASAPSDPLPAEAPAQAPAQAPTHPGARIQAVTLDARQRPSAAALRRVADLGATHLTLVSFGFQRGTGATQIRMHTGSGQVADGGGWHSETDAGIRSLARRAETLGMGLVLKPHLWMGRKGGSRLDLAFEEESDWQAWQAQYCRFLLHYARLAEAVEADLLVVGTELAGTSAAREAFWRGLIAEVRGVYSGKLTYAANWYDEYEAVPFWDALDFVGVQGYFPLSEVEDPSPQALADGWAPHRRALRRVSAEAERPLFFTELGYRSTPGAAAEPWRWPERGDATAPALQARLYEAFFEEVWPQPWVAGAALWKWPTDARRRRPAGFHFGEQPAAEVIRRAFGGDG